MRHIQFFAGITIGATACMVGSVALAQHPAKGSAAKSNAKATSAQPTTTTCAVEPADKVNIKTATKAKLYADYKGNRYFFCCPGCPAEFKKNPAKYAKNAHIKTPVAVSSHLKKKA